MAINKKQIQEIKSRVFSLIWRLGGAMVVFGLNYISEHLFELGLSDTTLMILSYVLGEITKWLNKSGKLGMKIEEIRTGITSE